MTPTSSQLMLETLARLNQIGEVLIRQEADEVENLERTLRLIVESTSEVVPGISATLYTFDASQGVFEPGSKVSAGPLGKPEVEDLPRPDGMGRRAIEAGRRVLSYEGSGLSIHPAKTSLGARIAACYPLSAGGETLGVLYIYRKERIPFSELDLLMLEHFVQLTALTLSLARGRSLAQQEQARKERELRRLRRAGALISSRTNLQSTLEAILRMALEVTDAHYGICRLVDKASGNLVMHAFSSEMLGNPALNPLPIDEKSIMGWVASRREPLVIDDLRQAPWRDIYFPLDFDLEMRSEVAVPLIGAGGRLEGVLNLESPHVKAFSKQDRYILQILSTQAVAAIQEVRLLDALQEISAQLLIQPVSAMHRSLVLWACDLLNVRNSALWTVEDGQLVLIAASNPELFIPRLSLEHSLEGKAVLHAQPVVHYESDLEQWAAGYPLTAFRAALVVPIFASDQPPENQSPIGAFGVYTELDEERDFEEAEWDKKVMGILGHYAALAIMNASHLEALRQAQEKNAIAETFAAVGDIASNLLHRLNNKIGTIPVRVQGIQEKSLSSLENDPYLEKNLAEIELSATESMEIVRDSLFHLRPIQFSAVRLADSVTEALASTPLPDAVRVECLNLEELPSVRAGPRRLTLVFVNLIENASEAMDGKGTILISGRIREQWVQVRITDSGPGIPPELQERIFEFSYSTRSVESPGKLGFGLWWVKTLINRFGGRMWVESDGHSGTTFIFELPQMEVKDET